ncbi:unnamed protein product [Fusarium graminearum]|uniref:Chromosome 1, complete genome n=1 Tax=Gibberella zeae (strain ATCC MYA-4620 / CBS 123657 / FGSC 9075 / NRRL 31084 / PH-1) TaxID=229533 RepID=A0A0E0RRD5_GIBZE|nr:hypothetical protein FG05_35021 [Fusarium graminearum]CEF73810.1 unnamed protein product [Fusarium graminearum]CZS77076.1 unnamed protein product [Fusarium graminearum]
MTGRTASTKAQRVAAKQTAARTGRIVRHFGGDFGIRSQPTTYWDKGGKTLGAHGVTAST